VIKSGNKEPSKSTSWKVLETVMSYFKRNFVAWYKTALCPFCLENKVHQEQEKSCQDLKALDICSPACIFSLGPTPI